MTIERIVAFDASTTNVGWCVMDAGGDVLDSGCFSPEGDRAEDRMPAIFGFAWGLIRRAVYPDNPWIKALVAIEEPRGNHGNRNTDFVLGRAYGMVEAAAYIWGCEVMGVNPQTVKATECYKDALPVAAALAGHECGEDEADAIGVALAARGDVRRQAWGDA